MAKRKGDLTQEDILAWADNLAGVKPSITADRQGVSTESVRKRRKKVADFIAEKFDINEYRFPMYALYGLFLNSVIHNLKKNDTSMTIAFGKGLNIFVDKQLLEATHDMSNISNDELAERVNRLVDAPLAIEDRVS